ncbi:SGNH/GDSL hydrolase family protein [Paenibacillus eucommiae]|uniref:Lysophospholipase L1-like esterase n=1 Tax=Paenibacillus eucommiae TaxID=1355755 RepID=A0ABS4ILN9_9BACL|nr:SGNH/GDSL hydrolase family protein [Paenibacillus eucommiae]MBP1988423.1 lysophospholipase L1-like esterase [Paenibacillus eucommiae]
MPTNMDIPLLLKRGGARVVITGDSLSYNRYDFEEEPRIDAYDCLPGIRSWSFMVRDEIHRSDEWFRHGGEVPYTHVQAETVFAISALPEFTFPFDNRTLTARVFEKEEELVLSYLHHNDTDSAVLFLGSVPGDTAAKFDIYVDGVYSQTVDNNGEGQLFQGYNPLYIEIQASSGKQHEICFKNWEQSAAHPHASGERTLHLLGIGSKLSPVYLTGQGGKTAEWLLGNLEARVTAYNPDLVLLILGANDRVYRTLEQFDQELRAVVGGIYASNPQTHVLLLAPPSSVNEQDPLLDDGNYIPDAKAIKYNDMMETIAGQLGCSYLDTSKVFAEIPIVQWRFDNVHLTKYGNKVLAAKVLEILGLDGLKS